MDYSNALLKGGYNFTMMTRNFLTFDIEEWFHANYDGVDLSKYDGQSSNLEANVDRLIDICAAHEVKSTCFILGDVAKSKPQVIKKLFAAGHEIASHGMGHCLIYPMNSDEFRADIHISSDVLEQITGQKVLGFRAPSWSVKSETLPWFYEILADEGFLYSSSVYPANHSLFGISDFPRMPHYPLSQSVLEIPQSVMNFFGTSLGYAGGGFLRFFPAWLIKREIEKENKRGQPVFIYLHPREIDIHQPRLELQGFDKFFHYQGILGCEVKLTGLIQAFEGSFIRMDEYAKKVQAEAPLI
jgi:polysaccharide deacetylase family protein (PEP-CTERM system associated)